MREFKDIEEICEALNLEATETHFFDKDPVIIDDTSDSFVKQFSKKNGLISHTITPNRWWFEVDNKRMFDDGQIELHPLINHAWQELHADDDEEKIQFVAVNVEDAKLTKKR